MNTQKINGVIISLSKFKDFDMLATIMTPLGLKRVKFIGVRKPKSKFAFAAQPFCNGEFVLSSEKDYAVVISVEQKNNFYELTNDYEKFDAASKMLILIKTIATENQDNEMIYNLILLCLSLLIAGVDVLLTECIFHCRLLVYMGLFSGFKKCIKCEKQLSTGGLLDINSGAIYCTSCGDINYVPVSKNIINFMVNLVNEDIINIINNNYSLALKKQTNELLKKIINNQI